MSTAKPTILKRNLSNKIRLIFYFFDVLDCCLPILVRHNGPVGEEHQPSVSLHLDASQEDHQSQVKDSNTLIIQKTLTSVQK